MNRILLIVLVVMVSGLPPLHGEAADFPLTAVSSSYLNAPAVGFGNSWVHDRQIYTLVCMRDRVAIISPDGVIWRSPVLEGQVTCARRESFRDGNVVLIAAYNDSIGWISEFSGENLDQRHDHVTGGRFFNQERDSTNDSRVISMFIPRLHDDGDRIILIGQLSYLSWPSWFGNYQEYWYTGSILEYDLDTDSSTVLNANVGRVLDCEWIERTAGIEPKLILGLCESGFMGRPFYVYQSQSSIGFLDSTLSSVVQINLDQSMNPTGPDQLPAQCFTYTSELDTIPMGFVLCSHPVESDQGFTMHLPSLQRYNLASQTRLNNLQFDSVGGLYSPIYYRESGADQERQFGLVLSSDYHGNGSAMMVIDLANFEVAAVYGFPSGALQNEILPAGNDGEQYMATLYSDSMVYYSVAPLAVPNSPSPLLPYTMSLTPYPNPFNSSTTIVYTLPRSGRYALDVVDINGRLVMKLSDGWKEAGSYRSILQGGELPSGIYIINLETDSKVKSVPVELVR